MNARRCPFVFEESCSSRAFSKRALRDFIAAEMAPACEDIILEQIARIRATDEVHEVSSVCARFAVD